MRCNSSRLSVSCEGTTAPAESLGASFEPVLMASAGLLIRLTLPISAMHFAFRGVPCFTSNAISILVGSARSGRTELTLPTVIPPNSTGVPGSIPDAFRR